MPVAVFIVGCMLGTEQYERNTLANMIFVSIGVAIASYGAPLPVRVCETDESARWQQRASPSSKHPFGDSKSSV